MNRYQNYYQNKKHKHPKLGNSTSHFYKIEMPPTEKQKAYFNALRDFLLAKGKTYVSEIPLPKSKQECSGRIANFIRVLYQNNWNEEFYEKDSSNNDEFKLQGS